MEEFLNGLYLQFPLAAPQIFIIVRSLAIIIPPISGTAMDIPAILIFGWVEGFIYAEIGVMLGALAAFLIARKFRERAIRLFVTLRHLHKWEAELSENRKFWYLVALRFFTSPFFDYISYAAGLTKIGLGKFMLTTFIGTLPIMLGTYYFGGKFLDKGAYAAIFFIVIIVGLFWYFRRWAAKRYGVKEHNGQK